jgi:hypothetical protein
MGAALARSTEQFMLWARTWFGLDDLKASTQKSDVTGSPSVRFAA